MSLAIVASLLLEASVALVIAAAGATIWCAFVPASDAAARRRIWTAVLFMPLVLMGWRAMQALGGDVAARHINISAPTALATLVMLWAGGVLALATRLALRLAGLSAWAAQLREHRPAIVAEARAVAGEIGIPAVRVVCGERGVMPLCWGFFTPTLLLPDDAGEWTYDLRRAVTIHECAHLRQGDNRLGPLVEVMTALFWFHPAMWIAARRVHVDSERACDELVVSRGIDPEGYARQLLAVARAVGRTPGIPAAALLGRAELEERIAGLLMAIPLESHRRRIWRTLQVAVSLAAVVAITPELRFRAITGRGEPRPLPGSDPGSFSARLFGGG